jgi:hypothetical protein
MFFAPHDLQYLLLVVQVRGMHANARMCFVTVLHKLPFLPFEWHSAAGIAAGD